MKAVTFSEFSSWAAEFLESKHKRTCKEMQEKFGCGVVEILKELKASPHETARFIDRVIVEVGYKKSSKPSASNEIEL